MLNFLKKAQKKLENILVDKYLISNTQDDTSIIKVNCNVYILKKHISSDFYDIQGLDKIKQKIDNSYVIFNTTNHSFDGFNEVEKIYNLKVPNYPAYTLKFVLEFACLFKEIFNKNKDTSFIFYDKFDSVSKLISNYQSLKFYY